MFYANAARYAVKSSREERRQRSLALRLDLDCSVTDPREAESARMTAEEENNWAQFYRHHLLHTEDRLADECEEWFAESGFSDLFPHNASFPLEEVSY
jgi:hypothetical protein